MPIRNISANHLPGAFDPNDGVPAGNQRSVTIAGNPRETINYEGGIHGAFMSGTINVI
jgi:hypothetical protein